MNIILETKEDYKKVEELTRKAFWNIYKIGCDEHYILSIFRNDSNFIKELSYVIKEDNEIVAHIAYGLGDLITKDNKIKKVLFFGPISVSPKYQRKGYGSSLIRYTLNKVKELGYNEVLITGNPDYYHRFGFERASKYNIHLKGIDINDEAPFFMINVLNDVSKVDEGIYDFPECFMNVDKEKLEEYDKQFKEKGNTND